MGYLLAVRRDSISRLMPTNRDITSNSGNINVAGMESKSTGTLAESESRSMKYVRNIIIVIPMLTRDASLRRFIMDWNADVCINLLVAS